MATDFIHKFSLNIERKRVTLNYSKSIYFRDMIFDILKHLPKMHPLYRFYIDMTVHFLVMNNLIILIRKYSQFRTMTKISRVSKTQLIYTFFTSSRCLLKTCIWPMLKIFTKDHLKKCVMTPVKKALIYSKSISYVAPPRKDQNNFSPFVCWTI